VADGKQKKSKPEAPFKNALQSKAVELEEELDDESEEEDAAELAASREAVSTAPSFDGQYVNKQRVLVFCSRGVTARARHLLEDLRRLVYSSSLAIFS
jgi:hypothetical protein